ncbi:MAG TPA: hypothetical protein VGD08_18080 [Stellaceae bacterium]|jgi:hypothetical protein
MTEQRQQDRRAGGKATAGETASGNPAGSAEQPGAIDDAAHAGDKPPATGGGKHPVDQEVQEETGKERAGNRGYD